MKKRLAVLFAIALCLLAVVPAKSAKAADPGSRYADAFVLIEQGQAAEEKSDLATAYHKYQASLDSLAHHSERFARLECADGRVPPERLPISFRCSQGQAAFPASCSRWRCVGDHTHGSSANPATSTRGYSSYFQRQPPANPAVKALPHQSTKFKAQIDKLEAENHQLKS